MYIRIRFSGPTVKSMQARLQQAYGASEMRLVRRISVLLEYVAQGTPMVVVTAQWGVSQASVYRWVQAFLLQGMASLVYQHGGGRRARLSTNQKERLCAILDAGPQAAGWQTACWNSSLIQVVLAREFGVAYNRCYIASLLRQLGYSYQKAKFVSDHLDEARRQAWWQQMWPAIRQAAQQVGGLILFGDEVSFAQWGSLGYTWARRGVQPTVKTSGKRRAYKVFGIIEFFSGRLWFQGMEGRFNSDSYRAFLLQLLAQTTEPLFLIQDGAKYHTSKAMRAFFAQHASRLTVFQLPSYSPDYNPIEYLWRKTRRQATHNQYFDQFAPLVQSVEEALQYFATHAAEVLTLFGSYCQEQLGLQPEHAA